MNRIVIGVGLLGMAFGFVSGYFAGKSVAEKKAEKYIESEIAKTISKFDLVPKAPKVEKARGDEPKSDFPENEERAALEAEFSDYLAAYVKEGENVKGVEVFRSEYDPEDPDSVEEDSAIVTLEEDGETVKVFRVASEPPATHEDYEPEYTREAWAKHIMSPDEWTKGEPGQHREEFTYYDEDDVLTDVTGVPIDDLEPFGDALTSFGLYGAGPNEVFLRNRDVGVDAHITRVHGSYEEDVLGVRPDDDSPRKMRSYYE